MDLVMISSPPNYKKHSEASEWLPVIPKSVDGTIHNDKDRAVSSRSIWLSRLCHWRSVVSSLPSLVCALGTNHSILRTVWSPPPHHKESRIVTKQGSCNSQSSLTRILSITFRKESSSPSTSWTPSLAQYSHVRLKPGNCKIISAYCFRFKWRDTLLCSR